MSHPTIFADELGIEIDAEVLPLVRSLNAIPGVTTVSSCQGNPGEIGLEQNGFYGSVTFHKGDWREISEFCFGFLSPLFRDLWDDVRVHVNATDEEYDGWIKMRNESIPIVVERLTNKLGAGAK